MTYNKTKLNQTKLLLWPFETQVLYTIIYQGYLS